MHDLGVDVDVTLQASGETYQYETSTVEEFDLHDTDCRRGTVDRKSTRLNSSHWE